MVHFVWVLLCHRAELAAENVAFRQQFVILQQKLKAPRLCKRDRIFWIWLSKFWAGGILHCSRSSSDSSGQAWKTAAKPGSLCSKSAEQTKGQPHFDFMNWQFTSEYLLTPAERASKEATDVCPDCNR
jgi:hypothetical protein